MTGTDWLILSPFLLLVWMVVVYITTRVVMAGIQDAKEREAKDAAHKLERTHDRTK